MFIVLNNHWFDLLRQSLNLKLSDDGEFLHWKNFSALCVRIGIFKVQKFQKMRLCWSIPSIELMLLSNTQFEIFHQGLKGKHQTSKRGLVRKIFIFGPCIRILAVRNCQKCYHLWCIYIIDFMFLPEYSLDFVHEVLSGNHYTFEVGFWLEVINLFGSLIQNCDTSSFPICAFNFGSWRVSNVFSP